MSAKPNPWSWFQQRSLLTRAVLGAVGVVVGVNVILSLGSSLLGGAQPSGPDSSSYATTGSGLAGWSSLLERNGHEVVRLRTSLVDADLPADATLVIADPGFLDRDDLDAASDLLRRGGRVVAAGAGIDTLAGEVRADVRRKTAKDDVVPVVGSAPEVAGLRELDAGSGGRFDHLLGLTPLVADGDRGVLVAATSPEAGSGRLVLLATSGPLRNERLGLADNAAFALQVVGASDAPVYFAETFHGYGGDSSGWSVLPGRWRLAFWVLLAAILVGMWALGRRFGPIEDSARALAPPRRSYVDAMGAGLARGHDPSQVVAPVHAEVRRRLRKRTGLGPDHDDVALAQAAALTGVPADDVLRALAVPADDQHLIAVCAAATRVAAAAEGTVSPQPGADP